MLGVGRDPNLKTIFASFSDDLGTRANKDLQRMFDNDYYKMLFPKTKLAKRGETWLRNTNILEFAGHSGSFRNVTVEGAINGMELNLGVIDDPHKGRNEANSRSPTATGCGTGSPTTGWRALPRTRPCW